MVLDLTYYDGDEGVITRVESLEEEAADYAALRLRILGKMGTAPASRADERLTR